MAYFARSYFGAVLPPHRRPPRPWPYLPARLGTLRPATLPVGFFDAAIAWCRANLAAAFPGGIVSGRAAAGAAMPYLQISDAGSSPVQSSDAPVHDGQLQAMAYASSKPAARALGDLVSKALVDAPLAFQSGSLFYLAAGPRSAAEDPDLSRPTSPVWVETRLFRYLTEGE